MPNSSPKDRKTNSGYSDQQLISDLESHFENWLSQHVNSVDERNDKSEHGLSGSQEAVLL